MQLSQNEKVLSDNLMEIISNYYEKANLSCIMVGQEIGEEIFQDQYMINKKHFFAYNIPRDGHHWKNYFPMIFIGIGPCFVSTMSLLSYDEFSEFSMGLEVQHIEHNLKLLDEYFAKQSCCTCCKCQPDLKTSS